MRHHLLLPRISLLGPRQARLARPHRRGLGRAARRFAYHAFMLVGFGIGLVAVLPVRLPAVHECPPPGEGLVACQLTGGPVRSLTILTLVLFATHLVARATLDWGPELLRKHKAGKPLLSAGPGMRAGSADHDRQLLAACWGDVGASRHPDPDAVDAAAAQWRAARHTAQPTGLARLEGRITWPSAPAADQARGDRSTTSVCPDAGYRSTGRRGSPTRPNRAPMIRTGGRP